MYNPCALLSRKLLDRMIKLDEIHFVRQSYPRGSNPWDPQEKGSFLFTGYKDIAFAQEHLGAIEHDPYRKIYAAKDEEDLGRLHAAAGQPAGYRCYTGVFRDDYEAGLTDQVKKRIRHYVKAELNWTVPMSEGLGTKLFLHYGDLYIEMKCRNKKARVKFEDIENIA